MASGEHCANRVLFKQFMSSGALQFVQPDCTRLAGVSEALAVLLLAARFKGLLSTTTSTALPFLLPNTSLLSISSLI